MSANKDRPVSAKLSPLGRNAYRIELSLSVVDASALWSAALEKGLAAGGFSHEDICDVIGPSEDPDLSACLTMLTAPFAIPGCCLDDLEVDEIQAAPSPAPANDFQLAARIGASA